MKKIYLLLMLVMTMLTVNAQPEKIPKFELYCNDTLRIESVSVCDLTYQSVFKNNIYVDKTVDDMFFTIHENWYILFVPKECIYYKVTCHQGSHYSIGNHLVYLIDKLRRN